MGRGEPLPLDRCSTYPGAASTTLNTWNAEKRVKIVFEGMSPGANISEFSGQHDICCTANYEWKVNAFAGSKQCPKIASGESKTVLLHENACRRMLVTDYAFFNDRLREALERRTLEENQRGLARPLLNAARVRAGTLAHALLVARTSPYPESRQSAGRRVHIDQSRAREPDRRITRAHQSLGYRWAWSRFRPQEAMFNNCSRVQRIPKGESSHKEVHFPRPHLPGTGNVGPLAPNRRCCADLSYVDTTDFGPVPLLAVIYSCTRGVVGHGLLRSRGAAWSLLVVGRAVLGRLPTKTAQVSSLKLETDGGYHFVAHRFQDRCRTIGISLMATRRRRPEDNSIMEAWNGHFKQDYLWVREPTTFLKTRQVVDRGVVDYNTQRPHSSLAYLTPRQYAEQKKEEQRA